VSALAGKRVLVTRAQEQASELANALRARGADPVVVPTIVIADPADPAPLARGVAAVAAGSYDWVAFTSANAVSFTLAALAGRAVHPNAKVAAVGPATARALEAAGLRADLVAKTSTGEGLAAEMLASFAGARPKVFLPRAAIARDDLPAALRAAGAVVDEAVAYETRPPAEEVLAALRARLERGEVDAVTFTSSSTVDNLMDALGPRAAELLARVVIASIGPKTTETATRRGLRVDATAQASTVAGLVDALDEFFSAVRV
jgi:uroporphyrinogen III methyltransferase/synthase